MDLWQYNLNYFFRCTLHRNRPFLVPLAGYDTWAEQH